jgi:hypothetical protein
MIAWELSEVEALTAPHVYTVDYKGARTEGQTQRAGLVGLRLYGVLERGQPAEATHRIVPRGGDRRKPVYLRSDGRIAVGSPFRIAPAWWGLTLGRLGRAGHFSLSPATMVGDEYRLSQRRRALPWGEYFFRSVPPLPLKPWHFYTRGFVLLSPGLEALTTQSLAAQQEAGQRLEQSLISLGLRLDPARATSCAVAGPGEEFGVLRAAPVLLGTLPSYHVTHGSLGRSAGVDHLVSSEWLTEARCEQVQRGQRELMFLTRLACWFQLLLETRELFSYLTPATGSGRLR